MSALNNVRGIPLGGDKPLMPEITIFPFADVDVIPGTIDHTDATHWLRIVLPMNGREIRNGKRYLYSYPLCFFICVILLIISYGN